MVPKLSAGMRPYAGRSPAPAISAELKGRVIAVEHLGGETYVYLERGGAEPLVVKAGGDSPSKVHDLLAIGVPAAACYLFDDQGQALPRAA